MPPCSQPNWSHFYAPGPEILEYLRGVARKYKLDRFIRYRHTLTRADWDEATGQWSLGFDLTDEAGRKIGETTKTADVVIQGLGGLSRWDWPKIAGLDSFKVSSSLTKSRP